MPPATASGPFRLFFVAGGTVWRARCRRRHSLAPTLSPDAQSGWRGRTESTGGDSGKPDSTPGDSWDPILPPSCRRGVSLSGWLSPGRQSGARVVAGGTVWSAGTGGIDRRRQLEAGFDRRRQLGPDFAPFVSPGRQSDRLAVSGTSVWRARCRRRHSLGRSLSPDAQSGTSLVIPSTLRTIRNEWVDAPAYHPRLSSVGTTIMSGLSGASRRRAESKDPPRAERRDSAASAQRHSATRDPSTPLAFGSLRSG